MLVRASRRKLQRPRHKTLQPTFEQLHLPWLCPALFSNVNVSRKNSTIASGRQTTTPAPSHSKARPLATVHHRPRSRSFAYATNVGHGTSQYGGPPKDYIPWEISSSQQTTGTTFDLPWSRSGNLTELTFDPSAPLIIQDSLAKAPRKFRVQNGISGSVSDIQETLRACLHVGRFDRAAATMRRLNTIYKLDAPELVALHTEYIGSLVRKIVRTKDQDLLRQLQKWFEVDMCARGIAPNPTTIALMIQAALQESKQAKIDRTIRRYIALADEAGFMDEAMTVALGMLNEQEIGRVTRMAPMTFHPAPEAVANDTSYSSSPVSEEASKPLLSDVPEIRSVKLKGLGMKTLQKSLSMFSESSSVSPPEDLQGSPEEIEHAHAFLRQERLEQDVLDSALDRWRMEHTSEMKQFGTNGYLQSIGSLMWQWHVALTPLLIEEIRQANEAESKQFRGAVDYERCNYGPFLQYLTPEKLSAVTILASLSAMSVYGVERGSKISALVEMIGNSVQDESVAESMISNRNPGVWKGLSAKERSMRLAHLIKRKQSHDSLARMIYDNDTPDFLKRDLAWSSVVKAKVGAVLLSHLIQAAKIKTSRRSEETGEVSNETQPVFWYSHQYELGRRVGMLRMNAALSTKLTREPVSSALSKNLPMVVEPVPWTGFKRGGFIRYPKAVVRIASGQEQLRRYIRAASDHGDMAQVFASLDVLGKTPWRINRGVFDVMVQAWNTGEPVAKLAPENPQYEYPLEPESSENNEARKRWAHRIKEINHERAAFHSQRCFQNFILEVARAYLKETFYFPHNVDFRGRAYPISPYLNHMGSDNCRGLLMFGKGKELGTAGLAWLKVHLANVFGFDKASLDERSDFTTEHLSDIYDSATRPLEGDKWWLKAEDPWQCLAACMELKNALESPDPAKFVSYLPIHQDGTCNGLQHYAALGGDAIGAKQVNLEPSDRPSDIYTAVANMVKSEVAVEAAQGSEIARLLDGKLTRKVVKQTVMTNVYGVTFNGAKLQVKRQLEDLLPDFPNSSEINLFTASRYIAHKIFKALSTMFNGAHDIQYWLGECASRICEALSPDQVEWIENNALGKIQTSAYSSRPTNEAKNKDEQMRFKTSVIWTTPLKMPVVQPYRIATAQSVTTRLQRITIMEPGASDAVSKRKQLQAFPPNFIHSLDATHMMLSALRCDELGMSFAAVHDSFWTHAADVDTMNSVLRDAFIKMHSENIIGRLAAEFSARYKDYVYLASIKANSALGRRITKLRQQGKDGSTNSRARQRGTLDELLMERRRMRLLASTDPAERLEGESIITPSRLVAETANEQDFVSLEVLENGIGEVSSAKGNGIQQGSDDLEEFENAGSLMAEFSAEDALVDGAKLTNDVGDPEAEKRAKKARQKRLNRKISVWVPLTFPPVPPKGDFDVSRLKNSQYFFS